MAEYVSLVGDSYLIKKILTLDEALKLLEEDPQIKLITKSESTHGLGKRETYYYESLVSGKTFLTPSVQNDILIKNVNAAAHVFFFFHTLYYS